MAIRAHLVAPKLPPQPHKFQAHPFPSISLITIKTSKTRMISCAKKISDAELASELATEVSRINTRMEQREEAMKKSRELLFTELCQHFGLKAEEMEIQWREMAEEEKWDLVKGFVLEWGANFHPLSAKSVKEMVDEHLGEENPTTESSQSILFPGLKRMMGFSPNN